MSEWQPIESAPRDQPAVSDRHNAGTTLTANAITVDRICVGQWDGDRWRYPGDTHWQPRPSPPYYPHAEGAGRQTRGGLIVNRREKIDRE